VNSPEIIERLLTQYTLLTASDIKLVIAVSIKMQYIAEIGNVDVFIDCPCKNPREAVVVAEANCRDTMYELSMIGYIIRDEDEPAVFRTFRFGVETQDVRAVSYVTTHGNILVQNVTPIKNGRKTIGVLICENRFDKKSDVNPPPSEEIGIQKQLDESSAFLGNLNWFAECIEDAVIVVNEGATVVYRNSEANRIYSGFGYIRDILGQNYNEVSLHGAVTAGPDNPCVSKQFTICGNYYHMKQFYFKRQQIFYIILLRNITQLKQTEENQIIRSIAIREAHHRIKNNLQTIHSLLDLQRRRTSSVECGEALSDAMNRILSIATTHEILVKSGVDSVSLMDVIKRISNYFLNSIDETFKQISVIVEGDNFDVDSGTSTSISLVINELLQNSFKYAFPDRQKGNIYIHVKEIPVYSKITISDDGVGFAQEKIRNEKNNLGLQIVQNIVKNKLKGRLDICSNEKGSTIAFDFKTYK
jgi:two-component sensor histidine kinase